MKYSIIKMCFLIFTVVCLINSIGSTVNAQGLSVQLEQPEGYGLKALKGSPNNAEGLVETIILNVITIFFAVGGIGVVVYFVWGAVDWILSGGDKEKIANARKKMTHAIIGLVLLSLSFVIINIIGQVVGFNPLSNLQLRGLGDDPTKKGNFIPN